MSKTKVHVECETLLLGIKNALAHGDNVSAHSMYQEVMEKFLRHIASDRDTRICCQNWITDLAHDIIATPYIPITRAP